VTVRGLLSSVLSILRRQPVDRSSESSRAMDRYRRIAWSGLANGGATAVTMAVGLISLPLTVRYLGTERYGLWVAIGSWLAVLIVSDLGIANGLVNLVAEAHGKADQIAARKHVSSALALLAGVALVLAPLFAVASATVPWATVFNARTEAAANEAGPTISITLGFFLLTLPLTIVGRVYGAYQEGYIASMWDMAGSIAGLAALLVTTSLGLGLPFLAFGILFARFVVSVSSALYLFGCAKPWLRPSSSDIYPDSIRRLLTTGPLFALANIGFLLAIQAPYIVGPYAVGLVALGEFGATQRLFGIASVLPLMFLGPLWPAYREALSRGDVSWVRRTFLRTYALGIAAAVALGIPLVAVGGWIVSTWISPSIQPGYVLLVLLSLWILTRVWQEIHSMLLNGTGRILGMAIYGVASAVLSLVLSYFLGSAFGLNGLVLGWVLGFLLVSGWLLPLDAWNAIRSIQLRTARA
jgi:O-antigen/teichoic acid export membrane protein